MKTKYALAGMASAVALILIAVWYWQRQAPAESPRVQVFAAPVSGASEIVPARSNRPQPPASGVDTRASATPNRVPSFGGQKDLWAFAKQAEESPSVAFKFEGYTAARECIGSIGLYEHFEKKVDQALREGNQQPYFAFRSLSARCAGFESAGTRDALKLRKHLKDQLQSSDSPLSALTQDRELTPEERLAAIRSGSPAALERALPRLDGVGIFALCDLGKACGADSYSSELLCLLSDVCGQELWADAAESFGSEWQEIQREKEMIVKAVKSGQLEALLKKK